MEGFFDRELSPISPYFVPSFVVLLFKGEGEISMQNATKGASRQDTTVYRTVLLRGNGKKKDGVPEERGCRSQLHV